MLGIIFIIAIIPTYAHHGHFLIDSGREAYYPTQVLLGKILYKDIFDIYGPFSYMFNALLFKFFGVNLNVLYLAGCACTILISSLIYLISKRFLPKFLSFSIAASTILITVLSTYLSNFIFPYSYAMLYGLASFLFSVWFLLKYQSSEKNLFLYLSCFFAGLCVSNKYEFLAYFIVILYAMIKIKSLSFKQYYYAIFCFLSIPVFCFGILFLQGLNINDLLAMGLVFKKMAQSQTLNYFYHRQGVYFSKEFMKIQIGYFLMTLFPLTCFLQGFRTKNKISAILLLTLSTILILKWTNPLSFSLLPILVVIFTLWDFKNLKQNTPLYLLTLSAILFSMKAFWGLIVVNYGAFFVSFLTITIIALIADKFKEKNLNFKAIGIYILLVSIVLSYNSLSSWRSQLIKTPHGRIYTDGYLQNASQDLINYINKHTKKTDTIVILPEGAMINFLTDRPTENYYTSLIPLYVEVFGEDKIIEHFKETKPEYIIFNNWNTKDYYFKYICQDYAVSFCNYVAQNYTQERVIDKGLRYLIFKKR